MKGFARFAVNATITLLLLTGVGSSSVNAQTLCGTAAENATLTLTAPSGYRISSIDFASYGTPNGSCGSFTTGSCHSATSMAVIATAFVNKITATITAGNGVFGDPCVGTVKRLYVQARYQAILPVTLTSFTYRSVGKNELLVRWTTEEEVNTNLFVLEISEDGQRFTTAGSVEATGNNADSYSMYLRTGTAAMYYLRLKMTDKDGRFAYSQVLRFVNDIADKSLRVFYDGSAGNVTIYSRDKQDAYLCNFNGQVLKKITLRSGMQAFNFSEFSSGIYLLNTAAASTKLFLKN